MTKNGKYRDAFDKFADEILYNKLKTPKGLVFIDAWGSCRHAANVAHLFFQAINTLLSVSGKFPIVKAIGSQ